MRAKARLWSHLRTLFADERSESVDPRFADAERERSLLHDEDGAIMIMGVLMAAFLVGMLYYIIGLGDAIAFRERMQDTSDSGAYTAAVVAARGMNLIVLLNLVMSAVVAILLALKLVEIIVIIGLAIAYAVGATCFGCTAPAIAVLNTIKSAVSTAIDVYEPIAQTIVQAAHIGQVAISYAFPGVGQDRAVQAMEGDSVSGSPASGGFVLPVYQVLPVEDHVFYETCIRGAPIATRLIAAPFRLVPIVGGRISRFVQRAALGLYHGYAAYFCGDGDYPSAPEVEDYDSPRPRNSKAEACQTGCRAGSDPRCSACSGSSSDACVDAVQEICFEVNNENIASSPEYCRPDRFTRRTEFDERNYCLDPPRRWESCLDDDRGTDAAPVHRGRLEDGRVALGSRVPESEVRTLCRDRVQQATDQCEGGRARNYMSGTYLNYRIHWREGFTCRSRDVRGSELTNAQRRYSGTIKQNRPPPQCLAHGWGPVPAGSFDYSSCDYARPAPIPCDRVSARTEAEALSQIGDPVHRGRSYQEVRITELYGCTRREPLSTDVGYGCRADGTGPDGSDCDEDSESGGDWEPPQRVCRYAGRDLEGCPSSGDSLAFLGGEDFQIRGISRAGREVRSEADRGTRVATWNATRGPSGVRTSDPTEEIAILGPLRAMGRLSVSQAEFYWDQRQDCNMRNPFGSANTNSGDHCDGYGARTGTPIEWMWDMAWAARLRRVAFPDDDELGDMPAEVSGVLRTMTEAVFAH